MLFSFISIKIILFCVIIGGTPGPNNFIVLTTAQQSGKKQAYRYIAGVCCGMIILWIAGGVGLAALFSAAPIIAEILKYISSAVLLYLAWRIATSNPNPTVEIDRKQKNLFLFAILFQWINPKAIAIPISGIASFVPNDEFFWMRLVAITLTFTVIYPLTGSVWVFGGRMLKKLLQTHRAKKITLRILGLMLALTVIWNFI